MSLIPTVHLIFQNQLQMISKIINSLDTNKGTGPDGISAKFVSDISKKYSEHAKTATVRSI